MRFLILAALALISFPAYAQNPVLQSGTVTRNHAAKWIDHETIQDAGPWSGGGPSVGISDLPLVGIGTPLCIYDAPITNSLGYHSLCLGANKDGVGGLISYNSGGGATPLSLKCEINGTTYDCVNTGTGNIMGGPPSVVDNLVLFNNTAATLVKDAGIGISEVSNNVATNALLMASATTKFPRGVWRNDYDTGRNAPPLFYKPSNAACTLNSGNGDNGSQVKSADGKCWLAQFIGDLDPQQWGCIGDGTTDDTVCLQATVNYAGALTSVKGKIALPRHFYCVTGITISASVEIRGTSSGVVGINETNSGLKACAPNVQLITVTGNGVTLANFALNGLGGNTSTTSYAIKLRGHENRIENMHINGFCNYLVNVGRHNVVDKNVFTDNVNSTPSSMCWIIIDGGNDVFPGGDGQTIGSIYTNNMFTAWGPSAAGTYQAAMLFQNSGGYYVFQNDIQRTNYGTMIKPLADKVVAFGLFSNTALGDTTNADGLLIDTTNANSRVEIVNINNSYIGRSGDWPGTFTWADARNVTIQSSGGGLVAGIHINHLQGNTSALANLAISGSPGTVTDVTIDNSTLCFPGQKTDAPNIALVNNASTLAIRNNQLAAACDSTTFGAHATSNIAFGSNGHNNMLITGNFFAGPWTAGQGPISDSGTALLNVSQNIINNNWPLDTTVTASTFISGGVIDPLYYPIVSLPGASNITNIRHPWQGRKIQFLMPNNSVTFTSGGGGTDPICATKTVVANDAVEAFYSPGSNCWAIH